MLSTALRQPLFPVDAFHRAGIDGLVDARLVAALEHDDMGLFRLRVESEHLFVVFMSFMVKNYFKTAAPLPG